MAAAEGGGGGGGDDDAQRKGRGGLVNVRKWWNRERQRGKMGPHSALLGGDKRRRRGKAAASPPPPVATAPTRPSRPPAGACRMHPAADAPRRRDTPRGPSIGAGGGGGAAGHPRRGSQRERPRAVGARRRDAACQRPPPWRRRNPGLVPRLPPPPRPPARPPRCWHQQASQWHPLLPPLANLHSPSSPRTPTPIRCIYLSPRLPQPQMARRLTVAWGRHPRPRRAPPRLPPRRRCVHFQSSTHPNGTAAGSTHGPCLLQRRGQ